MKDRKNIGEAPVRFSYYEEAGDVTLLDERCYCFLFILEGSIQTISPCRTEYFTSRTLAVVDKEKIGQCICVAGTALLEFLPPKRIDHFFKSASTVFGVSASEHIPITSEIDEWIERLRKDCLLGLRPNEYSYCSQLRGLLRQCPDIVLGTLVIPLHACALVSNKCVECRANNPRILK